MAVHDDLRRRAEADAPGGAWGVGGPERWRRPARVVRWLWVVLAVLVVVGPVVRLAVDAVRDDPSMPQTWLAEGARLVNLDAEANLPTYFSVALLASLAVALAVTGVLVRGRGDAAWPLLLPAAVAAFLSVDELASLHEQLALVTDALGLDGDLNFSWVVVGAVVALAVGAVLLVTARRLAPRLRALLVLAGALYLGGALVVETLTGPLFRPTPDGSSEAPVQSVPYVLLNAVEEGLEMAGALVALWAVLRLLRFAVGPRGLVVDLATDAPALRS